MIKNIIIENNETTILEVPDGKSYTIHSIFFCNTSSNDEVIDVNLLAGHENVGEFGDTSSHGHIVSKVGENLSGETVELTSRSKVGSYSAHFNSASYLTVPDDPSFNLGNSDFSIEFWIMPSSNSYPKGIVGKPNDSNRPFYIDYNTNQSVTCVVNKKDGSDSITLTSDAGSVPINEWSHIAFVRGGEENYGNAIQTSTKKKVESWTSFKVSEDHISGKSIKITGVFCKQSGKLPYPFQASETILNGTFTFSQNNIKKRETTRDYRWSKPYSWYNYINQIDNDGHVLIDNVKSGDQIAVSFSNKTINGEEVYVTYQENIEVSDAFVLFINGVQAKRDSGVSHDWHVKSNDAPLNIGRTQYTDSNDYKFHGYLDEFRFSLRQIAPSIKLGASFFPALKEYTDYSGTSLLLHFDKAESKKKNTILKDLTIPAGETFKMGPDEKAVYKRYGPRNLAEKQKLLLNPKDSLRAQGVNGSRVSASLVYSDTGEFFIPMGIPLSTPNPPPGDDDPPSSEPCWWCQKCNTPTQIKATDFGPFTQDRTSGGNYTCLDSHNYANSAHPWSDTGSTLKADKMSWEGPLLDLDYLGIDSDGKQLWKLTIRGWSTCETDTPYEIEASKDANEDTITFTAWVEPLAINGEIEITFSCSSTTEGNPEPFSNAGCKCLTMIARDCEKEVWKMWFKGVCEVTWRRADKDEQAAINERWGRGSCFRPLIAVFDNVPFYNWPKAKTIASNPKGQIIDLSNNFGIFELISLGAVCAPERKTLRVKSCEEKNPVYQALADIGKSPDYGAGVDTLSLYHNANSGSGNGHELYDKIKKDNTIYYSVNDKTFFHKVLDITTTKYSTAPGAFKDLRLDTRISVDLDQDVNIYLFENNLEEGCASSGDACCADRDNPWRNVYYEGDLKVGTQLYEDPYSDKPAKLMWSTSASFYKVRGAENREQWIDIKVEITGKWTEKRAWENAKRLVRQLDDCDDCKKLPEEKKECEEPRTIAAVKVGPFVGVNCKNKYGVYPPRGSVWDWSIGRWRKYQTGGGGKILSTRAGCTAVSQVPCGTRNTGYVWGRWSWPSTKVKKSVTGDGVISWRSDNITLTKKKTVVGEAEVWELILKSFTDVTVTASTRALSRNCRPAFKTDYRSTATKKAGDSKITFNMEHGDPKSSASGQVIIEFDCSAEPIAEEEECEEVKWTWINLRPRWMESSNNLWDCVLKADDIKIKTPKDASDVSFWVTAKHSTYEAEKVTADMYCEGNETTTGEGFIATKAELLSGINLTKKDKTLSNNKAFHLHYLDCLDKDSQTKGYWQILVKPFNDCHSSCKKNDLLSDESWGQSACPCAEDGKVTYSTNTSGLCECNREDISIYATDALVNCEGIIPPADPVAKTTPTPAFTPTPTPTPTAPDGEWICFECEGGGVSTKRGFSSKALCEDACPQDSGADSHECLFEAAAVGGIAFSYDYQCAKPTPTPKNYHACCTAKKCSDDHSIFLYVDSERTPKYDVVYKLDNGEYIKEIGNVYFKRAQPTSNILSDLDNYWDDCESLCSKEFKDVSHHEHPIKKHGEVYIKKGMHHRKHFDGSAYFDGQGDYLSIPKSKSFILGEEDFTIECWFYIETMSNPWLPEPGTVGLISNMGDATSGSGQDDNGWVLGYDENDTIFFNVHSNETTTTLSLAWEAAVQEGDWYHVAVQRKGSSATLWLNGLLLDSTEANCLAAVGIPCIIGGDISYDHDLSIGRFYSDHDSYYHKGYINEIRISNKARYTNEFFDKLDELGPFINDKKTQLLVHFDCVKPTGGFPSEGLTNYFPMGEGNGIGGTLGGSGGSIETV